MVHGRNSDLDFDDPAIVAGCETDTIFNCPEKTDQTDRDEIILEEMPTVSATIGAIYCLLGFSHLLFLAPPEAYVLSFVSFSIAAFLLCLFQLSRKSMIPVKAAHATLFFAACLALAISTLHFYLYEQTHQATNFSIVLMGWGLMALSVRWFIVYYCLVGLCWIGVIQFHPHDPDLIVHYSFLLLSAAGIGTLAFTIRYRACNKVISHRRETSKARATLQRALDRVLKADGAERKTEAKDTFLAHFSHELRTPLNAIVGFSEVMKLETMGAINNSKYAEYIDDIHDAGLHLTSLLEDLHDLSLIEKGEFNIKLSTFHVDHVLDRSISLLQHRAATKNMKLDYKCDSELLYLTTDEKRFRQILTNLLTNAVKYTPENGEIFLLGGLRPNGQIYFEVRDNGIGMSETDLENAMSPFWQGKSNTTLGDVEGSGLGLSITQKLVSILGGTLELTSTKGAGTVAKLSLPPSCRALDAPTNNPFEVLHTVA